jgi:hypothetical protein
LGAPSVFQNEEGESMFEHCFDDSPSYYEVAQIGLNGHVITDHYQSSPERRKSFCPQCGAKTIHQCPNCGTNIQGDYIVPNVIAVRGHRNAPAFCHSCGTPFPWTEMHLQAARELTLETEELDQDKDKLIESLPDLIADTPKTTIAVKRW